MYFIVSQFLKERKPYSYITIIQKKKQTKSKRHPMLIFIMNFVVNFLGQINAVGYYCTFKLLYSLNAKLAIT